MDHDETGCQAPDRPILCINNCGLVGSSATRYMCSKCHKEMVIKEEQEKLAISSINNIVKESSVSGFVDIKPESVEKKVVTSRVSCDSSIVQTFAAKKESPSRCNACRKRVGLIGFSCRCGNLFCATHRYSDKHDCPFDYRAAARNAIAKANPVIKSDKLEKI